MRVLVIGGISRSLVNFRGPMLRAMLAAGHEVFACAGEVDETFVQRLETMGVSFRGVDLKRRGTNVFQDWHYSRAIYRVISEIRPDVVLSYTIKPVIYGSLAAARLKVATVAAMITGAGAAQPGSNIREIAIALVARRLYGRALRTAHVLFFQNPDDEMLFREHRLISQSRVVQIPGSGVDLNHYAVTPAVTDPVTFLLIARLLANKGVREYAAAARQLRQKYAAVRCLLVGPTEKGLGGIPENEVQRWQNEGTIEYLGRINDVRPSISSSSVYVLPSYREGTPRTVLEAMSMQRAVITTDTAGCRETVENGVNGFLVPVGDVGSLVTTMQRFVENPQLIVEMGKRSRQMAEKRYDVRRVNNIILSALGL